MPLAANPGLAQRAATTTEEPVPETTEEPAPEVTAEPASEATDEPEATAEPEDTEGLTVAYYDPRTGAENQAGNVTPVTADVLEWTTGWYAAEGAVSMGGVSVSGDVNLILVTGAALTVDGGILVQSGGSLTIWGQNADYARDGALTVTTGGSFIPAIGAGYGSTDVTVNINGGRITATGGYHGAGIGAGINDASATVNINGGVVNATGGNSSAGIGSGFRSTNATVNITGGTITATGGETGAGIGSGYYRTNAVVTISGGAITATGGQTAAGVGAGWYSGATVTVSGGVITAVAGSGSVGLGAGPNSSGTVTITGGSVKADSVSPQPVNADGEPVYLLQVANPDGAAVTVDGKAWNVNNHAAANSGDTDLYMYLHGIDGAAGVVVGSRPAEKFRLNGETNRFEDIGQQYFDPLTKTASYYDPAAGTQKTAENVTLVTDGVTEWTGGWYVMEGTVSLGQVGVTGDANLILPKGTSLRVDGGILVNGDASITIWGSEADYRSDGVLTANGAESNAAIGYSGTVTINGGVVNANGGQYGAGIGSGLWSSGATVNIHGGVINASAGYRGVGIGSGVRGGSVTVNITGGAIKASGDYANIGTYYGGSWATVIVTGGSVKGGFNVQPTDASGNPVYLLQVSNPGGGTVTANGKTWNGINNAAADGDNDLYMYLPDTNTTVDVTVAGGAAQRYRLDKAAGKFQYIGPVPDLPRSGAVCYNPETNTREILENLVWVQNGAAELENGWYVVPNHVVVDHLDVYGNVDLVLEKAAFLEVQNGIEIKDGGTLTIWGSEYDYNEDGAMVVYGAKDHAPGIGPKGNDVTATIIINGGHVTATGGYNGSGIGGDDQLSDATVIINRGVVTATSPNGGAGIGAGHDTGTGTVVINDGIITATGGDYASGIGGGGAYSKSTVTINGGTITATGGYNGVGIGAGYGEGSSTVTINGGVIDATGGQYGAGIGAAGPLLDMTGSTANVTINGGAIKATGGQYGAGIGGTTGCTVTVAITGGTITATGGANAAGVGAGYQGGKTSVTIDNASVHAVGGANPQPKNSAGETLYALEVANPDGGVVTVNDKPWAINNHVAVDNDTNLYMFVPDTETTVYVSASGGPIERYNLNTETKRFEHDERIVYYDPAANATVMRDSAALLTGADGQEVLAENQWNNGWFVVRGAVSIPYITVQGDINLLLTNGAALTVDGGVTVMEGGHLTIWGQDASYARDGVLTVHRGIGINGEAMSGTITINGGVINATGGGAAIGSGGENSHGAVIINSGVVNANGNGGTAIGCAGPGSDISVTINGGTVTAIGDEFGASLGRGGNGGHSTVTITGGSVWATSYMTRPVGPDGKPAYLLQIPNPNGEVVTVNGRVWEPVNHTAAGGGDTNLYLYLSAPDVYVTVGTGQAYQYVLNEDMERYEVSTAVRYYDPTTDQTLRHDAASITTGMASWTDGWYAMGGAKTLDSVTVTGDVNLILSDGADLTVSNGIRIQSGGSLTVWGQNADYTKDGSLTVTTNGILCGSDGAVTINGGTVTVTTGGIVGESGAAVTINGGVIDSNGGEINPGIGSGEGITGVTVTINGGSVTATGDLYGAGIGSGRNGADATVVINGGTVKAINNGMVTVDIVGSGAGIGAGFERSHATVTINGGTVTANGGNGSAGIGGGYHASTATVTINGGVVTATGGYSAAGIGSGFSGEGSEVTINGGVVTGIGTGSGGVGIGTGWSTSSATVTIHGGTVTAQGSGGADIGSGYYGKATVLIDGGSVKTVNGIIYPQPVDANGDPAWLLALPNPGGMAVTINGKAWQPRNHAAYENDTTLYAYLSKAAADGGNLLRVTMNGEEKLYVIHSAGISELTGIVDSDASWSWPEDMTGDGPVTASLSLPLAGQAEPITMNARAAVVSRTDATCETGGSVTYTATVTINGHVFTDSRTVELKPLGHAWSASVQWPADRGQATVTFTCGNDATHVQTVTVDAAIEVTKEPTCTAPGARECQADASEKAKELGCPDGTGVFAATVAIPALGHDWDVEGDEISLIPGVNGDFTTVTITCRHDHSHTRTVYTNAERISVTPATCTAEGSETYQMSYEVDGVKHVLGRTETVTLPMVPHAWGEWVTVSGDASGGEYERECATCHAKEQSGHKHTYVFPADAQWNVVNDRVVSATVAVRCSACDKVETLTCSGSQIVSRPVTQAATCTTGAWTNWTVTVDLGGQTQSYVKQTFIPARGHSWTVDETSAVWSEDYKTAAFTFRCATCGEETTVRVDSAVLGATEATCEQTGETVYSAGTEYGGVTASATRAVQTPALGHDWDVEGDEYGLRPGVSGDFTTLTVFCKHDPAHTQTVYTGMAQVKNEPATCMTGGVTGYRMEYTFGGQSYLIGEETDYEIPALGHRCTAEHVCAVCGAAEPVTRGVTYDWTLPAADDADSVTWTKLLTGAAPYVTVTAVRTGSDSSRMEMPLVVTELKAERTEKCEDPGTTKYTAEVSIGGTSAAYTIDLMNIAPAGHLWSGETPVKWSDDMRTATFTLTCARDGNHTETVTAQAAVTTVAAAACETAGAVRYTATAQTKDGTTVSAEQTKETAALGHAWCLSANDANPPKLERVNGVLTATITCRNDASHTWTTTDLQETVVDTVKAAACTETGSVLVRVAVASGGRTYVLGEEVRATPATGHSWGEWKTVGVEAGRHVQERTCSVCGETERKTVDAPAPLVTVANAADGIKLSWTQVQGADTYRVYYRVHGESWHAIGHTAKLTYTWKHGTDGQQYEFTVRGCTVSGSTKTPMPGKYNTSKTIQFVKAPTVTVRQTAKGIQISWTKVAGADTYRVYYRTVGGKWHAIGHNSNLTYTWKHGTAGRTYQFTVRPCTISGTTKTLFGAGYNTSKSVKFPK